MTQDEFDVRAVELLVRAKAKLAAAGVSTSDTVKGAFSAGGVSVRALWKHVGYRDVVGLKVGISYHRRHEHIFGERANGKSINWDGFVTEVLRQIGVRVANEQTQRLVAERHAESKRLTDEMVARHGLRPVEVEHDGAFLLRHGARYGWDGKLSVKTFPDGEKRSYSLELELSELTPEQLDAVLTHLKPVIEEHSLNQPEVATVTTEEVA